MHASRRSHIHVHKKNLANEICIQSNQARKTHNRRTLIIDAILNKAAQRYADTLSRSPYFSHTNHLSIFGRTPLARVLLAGGSKATTAENLIKFPILDIPVRHHRLVVMDKERSRYRRPNEEGPIAHHTEKSAALTAIQSWLDSPGHRKNLLYPSMTHIGCGSSLLINASNVPMIISVQVFQSQ